MKIGGLERLSPEGCGEENARMEALRAVAKVFDKVKLATAESPEGLWLFCGFEMPMMQVKVVC